MGACSPALFDAPVVILRPSFVYGPGQEATKLIPHVITALLEGRSPELSSGERLLDCVYAHDVARAYVEASRAPGIDGRTIDLGTGVLTSVRAIVEAIEREVGETEAQPAVRAPGGAPAGAAGGGRRLQDGPDPRLARDHDARAGPERHRRRLSPPACARAGCRGGVRMSAPAVSVVTATHNRADRLGALLAGLRAQTLPAEAFEVVIVDDASSDETPELLERESRRGDLRLRTLRNEQARGPATARNRGWRLATAPLIAFTDDDCVPTGPWLQALLAAAAERPEAIITGRTLPDPSETDALGPYAKTVSVTGPSPALRDLQRGLSAPAARARRRVRRELCRWPIERAGGAPAPAPPGGRGFRPRLSRDGRGRAPGLRGRGARAPRRLSPRPAQRPPRRARGDRRHPVLQAEPRAQAPPAGRGLLRPHAPDAAARRSCGLAGARRNRLAALLALPYARNLFKRFRASGATPVQAPFFLAFDLLQVAATARGAVRHRLPII